MTQIVIIQLELNKFVDDQRDSKFIPLTYNGRVGKNGLTFRSQVSKIRDMRIVDTHH